jgi:hypothetical protein
MRVMIFLSQSKDKTSLKTKTFSGKRDFENNYEYRKDALRNRISTISKIVTRTSSALRRDIKTHLKTDSRTLYKFGDHSYIQ